MSNKVVALLFLCVMRGLYGMEISHEMKDYEKKLLNQTKKCNYRSLSSFGDNALKFYHQDQKSDRSWHVMAKLLPSDLKEQIAIEYVKLYCKQHKINGKSDPLLVLHLVCRAQNICPLRIGNRAYVWKDIIVLTKEQQHNLFITANPDSCYTCLTGFDNNFIETPASFCTKAVCCLPQYCSGSRGPDIKFLEDQPEHIKKNLSSIQLIILLHI